MSTEVSKYRRQVEAAFRDVLFNNMLVIRDREFFKILDALKFQLMFYTRNR